MRPHLVVDISAHGYGHAGMTLPVLQALPAAIPDLKLTIRTGLPRAWLADRLDVDFDHLPPPAPEEDFGLIMENAMTVRAQESLEGYRRIHATLPARIDAAAGALAALSPSLLVSNIPNITLAGARKAGVPALAYSTLNWADMFREYCGGQPGADAILAQMVDAYGAAEYFIQPTPFMAMPCMHNPRPIGPVSRIGCDRRTELRSKLGMQGEALVILVGLGGLPMPLQYDGWPDFGGNRILLGSGDRHANTALVDWRALEMPFIDLTRSCDVIVAKSGYGMIVEAGCNGTPLLQVIREGWPETGPLTQWLAQCGQTVSISESQLRQGDFLEKARQAHAHPVSPRPDPSGIGETVRMIGTFLR